MKAKVLKKFRDKYTKEVYEAGDEIEVAEERAAEILTKGELIAPIATSQEVVEKEKKPAARKKSK